MTGANCASEAISGWPTSLMFESAGSSPSDGGSGLSLVVNGSPARLASTSDVTSPSWVSTVAAWITRSTACPWRLSESRTPEARAGAHAGEHSCPKTGPTGGYPGRTRRARTETIARRYAEAGMSRPAPRHERILSRIKDDDGPRVAENGMPIIIRVGIQAASTDCEKRYCRRCFLAAGRFDDVVQALHPLQRRPIRVVSGPRRPARRRPRRSQPVSRDGSAG